MNQLQDIHNLVNKRASQEVENNRLCLKATIRTDWWLAFQASAFKGHDESHGSKNWGNFIELLKLPRSHNDKLSGFVLGNAPRQNAKYTSHKIQQEILNIFTSNVRRVIHDEIEDSNFCIIIDEAKQEQITIILWFVDKDGFIWEHFFHVMHVKNTTTLILKQKVCNVVSRYDIFVEHIRGQWYDGVSNIRGE